MMEMRVHYEMKMGINELHPIIGKGWTQSSFNLGEVKVATQTCCTVKIIHHRVNYY